MNTLQADKPVNVPATRIIWAIASKDIVDALKNRTILAIMVGVVFMLLSVQALPLLLKLDNRPRLAVYDPDRTLFGELRRSDAVQAGGMRSFEEVYETVQSASGPLVGLDLPSGLLEGDGPVTVAGYVPHWVKTSEVATLQAAAEGQLTTLAGRPVTVEVRTVYPEVDTVGRSAMLTSGFVLAVLLTALIVVPFLFLEERESNTLALLTLSPASPGEVVAGKAIAGLVYSLAAVAVLLVLNLGFIVTWAVFLIGILAGTAFAVMLGLLLGIIAESHNALSVWAVLLAAVLILPATVTSFSPSLPGWLDQVLPWLPSIAMADLLQLSYARTVDPGQIVRPLAVLLVFTSVLFLLVVWRTGRMVE